MLPASIKARVSIEAGVTDYWFKYIGNHGRAVGVDAFGMSAPYQKVYEHFGLTAASVVTAVEESIANIGAAAADFAAH